MRRHMTRSGRPPLQGATCLIVDDDPTIRGLLRRILERHAASVVEVDNGTDAVATALECEPDVILLDYELPGVDGLTICRTLRNHDDLYLIPVVMITGADAESLHVAALEAGADDLMSKPIHHTILTARLANLVLRRRAELENERLLRKLESYVSEPARGHVLNKTGIERVEATVMFSDLRGFTATSFKQDPLRVFVAVSSVLARQVEIVRECGGYTDKFSGDGLLAVFEGPEGAKNACRAARWIVNWAWDFDLIAFWNPPPIGLGIHHGDFLRGDMGGEMRREFTVLGHTVNVAARLCGIAGPLEAKVSSAVVERVGEDYEFDEGELRDLKGMPANSRIHTLKM